MKTASHAAVVALAIVALVGCGSGSGSSAEATFIVSENDCKTPTTFTKKEVIETWGQEAVSGEELKGTPAKINAECNARKEGK